LEPSQKIAGFACRIHAFVVQGTVDAQAQTGRIWHLRLVPGTRGKRLGRDPLHKTRVPAPARLYSGHRRHAAGFPRLALPVPVLVVVA
jgi:hypothetical protein